MTPRRVLLLVQPLRGVGPLTRAAAIARACAQRGLEATLASGGPPLPGLDLGGATLVQLPALRARDETFATLVDENGQPIRKPWKDRRRDKLLELFAHVRPHVLVVEMFPFARRRLRFEILPLIEAARAATPRARILSSVRDALGTCSPRRTAEVAKLTRSNFDAVLVHGDPKVIRFDESFPAANTIADIFVYTGYVAGRASRRRSPRGPGWNEVVVRAGDGAVGEKLLRTAIEARPYSRSAIDIPWRLVAGADLDDHTFAAIAAAAPDGTNVERDRPDHHGKLLANCAVSVSRGDYDTVVDALQARARTVIVAAARGGQSELGLRAARLEALGLARRVEEHDLAPAHLIAAIDAALAGPRPRPAAVALDGAERSATVIANWAARADD